MNCISSSSCYAWRFRLTPQELKRSQYVKQMRMHLRQYSESESIRTDWTKLGYCANFQPFAKSPRIPSLGLAQFEIMSSKQHKQINVLWRQELHVGNRELTSHVNYQGRCRFQTGQHEILFRKLSASGRICHSCEHRR
jgi:hypothetical protein